VGNSGLSESERLEVLRGYEILDTPEDPSLNAITRIAGRLTGAPTALVSLVDQERQWFKARRGFDVDETERSVAFCDVVVRSEQELVVEDALRDERFADSLLVVGDPQVRFYAGVPLRAPEGAILGTLCVKDYEPRSLSDQQLEQLRDLASLAVQQIVGLKQAIDLERGQKQLRETNATLRLIQEAQNELLEHGVDAAWWDSALSQLLELTKSEYGFIGRIHEDDEGPFLKTEAITNIAWDEATRRFYEENSPEGLVFRNMETLFGRPILERQLLISNDVAHDGRAGGRPDGHPPLETFAGIPVLSRGNMIGLVGLANRKAGYSEELVEDLSPVLAMLSAVLENSDLEAQRQEVLSQLRSSNDFLERVLEASDAAFLAIDANGDLVLANRRAHEVFTGVGAATESGSFGSIGEAFTRLFPHADDRAWLAGVWKSADGTPAVRGATVLDEQLKPRQLELSVAVLPVPNNGSARLLISAADLTEQIQLHESRIENTSLTERVKQLRQQQRVNEILFECVELLQHSEGVKEGMEVIALSMERLFPKANLTLFALESDEETMVSLRRADRWEDSAPIQDTMDPACWGLRSRRVHGWWSGGHQPLCQHAQGSDASSTWCLPLVSLERVVALMHITFPPKSGDELTEERFETGMSQITAVAQTISGALSTIALRESLHELASTDVLTGLWNRRAFEQECRRAVARNQRKGDAMALAILDVDYFKRINDDLGHDVGDQALKKVAAALNQSIRLGDFAGRIGGEEFGIFLSDVGEDGAGASMALERVLDTIRTSCSVQDRELTASIGFTVAMEPVQYGDLYKQADRALYHAKRTGRDRLVSFQSAFEADG